MIRRGKVPLLSECGDKLRLIGGMAVNIRYTLSWCIFGVPGFGDHSSMSPCSQNCRSISDAVEKNILNATASSTYDFCDELSSPADLSPCSSCYSSIKTQLYFSNCKLPHDPFLAFANQFFSPFFPPSDLNLLRSACELKIPIPTPFPIIGSHIFTNTPFDSYPSSLISNSLSYGAKLAIGIAIPSTLLLLVVLALLLWYIRDYKRRRSSISNQIPRFPSPPTKPLPYYYKSLPPHPPIIKQNKPSSHYPPGAPPTVFHPTPPLRKLSPTSPTPKPLQPRRPWPHVATQLIFTPLIHHRPATLTTRATNVTTGPALSPFSSPPRRSAMQGSSRMPSLSRGVVAFEHGGGRKKHRNKNKNKDGLKERGKLEISLV